MFWYAKSELAKCIWKWRGHMEPWNALSAIMVDPLEKIVVTSPLIIFALKLFIFFLCFPFSDCYAKKLGGEGHGPRAPPVAPALELSFSRSKKHRQVYDLFNNIQDSFNISLPFNIHFAISCLYVSSCQVLAAWKMPLQMWKKLI